MSSTQLWAPQSQKAAEPAVKNASGSPTMPGTWLQLAPTASPNFAGTAAPEASQAELLPSPALNSAFQDEFAGRPTRFLSNTHSNSRTSSVSSASTVSTFRHPALGQRSGHQNPSIERREVSIGRIGGLGAAFYANH